MNYIRRVLIIFIMLLSVFILLKIGIRIFWVGRSLILFILHALLLPRRWNIYLLYCLLMFADSLPSCLKLFDHFLSASLSISLLWNNANFVWISQRLQSNCLLINSSWLVTILFKFLRHNSIANRFQTCCFFLKYCWLCFNHHHLIIHSKFWNSRSRKTSVDVNCLCLLGLWIIWQLQSVYLLILLVFVVWIGHKQNASLIFLIWINSLFNSNTLMNLL